MLGEYLNKAVIFKNEIKMWLKNSKLCQSKHEVTPWVEKCVPEYNYTLIGLLCVKCIFGLKIHLK